MAPTMDLASLGRLISEQRCARGLTLAGLAAEAGVGRSTLAALESGKLPELGFSKVVRICTAAGILLESRPPLLYRPLPAAATKDRLIETILRGDTDAWEEVLSALRKDDRGLLAERIRSVVRTLDRNDPNVAAFIGRLPGITRRAIARAATAF